MGSVSRRRWRRGAWGALDPTNGMSSWTWLLAAVLLSLLSVSVARPRLTATKEEEATLEPEGKRLWDGDSVFGRESRLVLAFSLVEKKKCHLSVWSPDVVEIFTFHAVGFEKTKATL